MNRPSLYCAMGEQALAQALAHDVPLDEALRRVYRTALSGRAGERRRSGDFGKARFGHPLLSRDQISRR
jgi:hypothetical protein